MIKGKEYCNYVDTNELAYATGDIMVMYTDGITEAKDPRGEEFGYDRLQTTFMKVVDKEPKEIQEFLITQLYEYSGTHLINDDYTTVIVKFK